MRPRTLFFLLILLLATTRAAAQGPASLRSLQISLWPEFDTAQLLVILDADLSQSGQAVHIPIPANAEINAVAVGGSDGGLVNAAYETSNRTGGQVITLTPANTKLRVEYYTSLPGNGAQRTVKLELPAGYLIADAASIEVLLPASASILSSQPELQARGTGIGDGLLFQRDVGVVKASTIITQDVAYDNPTGAFTVLEHTPAAPAPTSVPAPAPSPTPAKSSSWGIWLLAFLAIVLIAAGLFGVWRTRQPHTTDAAPAPPPTRRGPARKPAPAAPPAASTPDRFCRKCGAEFQREDRFCRQCGTARR